MSVSSPIDLEVCVDSLESAIEAVQKGASSVELCFSAHDGGYSPSIGLLKVVKDNLPLPIFVVVRPYRTDYCYSESEFEIMKEEISIAKHVGANGFVLGVLSQNNQLDINRCSALISLCRPLPCTLSRAFDEIANPIQALDDAIKCGFERILVSTDRYMGGTQLIATLQEHAQNRIKIIPARNTESTTVDQLREENKRLHEELAAAKQANSNNNHGAEETEHGGLGAFSLGSLLSHPSVLSKLQNIDIRFLLADLLRSESDRYNTNSPLDSTPASPQMASVQRLRNISPSNEGLMKSMGSPDNNGLEYVSAFNPLKPTIMVSGMINENNNVSSRDQHTKPTVQRRDSLQVPGSEGFAGTGFTRRRSLDDPTSNNISHIQPPMDTSDLLKECHNMKKERSLSAPEALYYPSIVDQVLAFKQDPRLLGGSGNAGNASGSNLRGMLRMNVRRGPLQKKLDALKASTHIDEEFNAVMNVNENSNDSEPNQNLNNSLKEMDLCDYSMVNKRRRWYGPNQKKIDDSNLMHALKSGLEYSRTLKQESDFNVFKKEVETLYEGSECINERTIMCGKCGKTHHLSWLRYHQQFNTEHWIQCTGGNKASDNT